MPHHDNGSRRVSSKDVANKDLAPSVRALDSLIDEVRRFIPRRDSADLVWNFYPRVNGQWHRLTVREYSGTYYGSLQSTRRCAKDTSFTLSPGVSATSDLTPAQISPLRQALRSIHSEVSRDPLSYHADLYRRLSPHLRLGVIPRALVQSLLPDWLDFDLTPTERTAALAVLDARDPKPLPTFSSGRFFEYVKTAYLANPGSFTFLGRQPAPEASGLELYREFADHRHGGLDTIDPNSEEALLKWIDSSERLGAHPFEIFRGGNSTHISLHIVRNKPPYPPGWRVVLEAFASSRLAETARAAVALHKAGMSCEVAEPQSLARRLRCEDFIGVLPRGSSLAYGWQNFPRELAIADSITLDSLRCPTTDKPPRPWREITRAVQWLPIEGVRVRIPALLETKQ